MAGAPEPVAGDLPGGCTHRWLIEHPDGETSRGICKYCGEIRLFRNSDAWTINPWRGRGYQRKSS